MLIILTSVFFNVKNTSYQAARIEYIFKTQAINTMKHIFQVLLFITLTHPVIAADQSTEPKIEDLNFLLGTWEITFEIYDTHQPERGVLFTEVGTQHCEADLLHRGAPAFITCTGKVTATEDSQVLAGRTREFRESIRFNRFIGALERIGQFSNWPTHSEEVVLFHPAKRTIEFKGELVVQDSLLERYEDIYQFNENYTAYERTNVANFSDMPVTVFNLTLKGTGKKIIR